MFLLRPFFIHRVLFFLVAFILIVGMAEVGNEMLLDGKHISQHKTTTSEEDYYFDAQGNKITFQRVRGYTLVVEKPQKQLIKRDTIMRLAPSFVEKIVPYPKNPFGRGTIYKVSDYSSFVQYFLTQNSLQADFTPAHAEYFTPILMNEKGGMLILTNEIIVKRQAMVNENDLIANITNQGLQYIRKLRLSRDEYLFKSSDIDATRLFKKAQTLHHLPMVK